MPDTATPHLGRILLADDDEVFRNGLAALMQREGYECHGAATGKEVLGFLRDSTYEALICDINMPGNVELELIQDLPRVAEGLPIILLTGQPSVETAAKSVRLPVMAYLVKPPDLPELRALLRQAVSNYRRSQIVTASRQRLRDWDQELQDIQLALRKPAEAVQDTVMTSYLRLTLRHLILLLTDLERSSANLEQMGEGGVAWEKLDLIGALRRTIQVLEKTKQHFKCKDLGDLRTQLEELLRSH